MSKKVSQNELRLMMAKLKEREKEKGGSSNKLKKYKLSAREVALIDEEKKRKAEEQNEERRKFAKNAGVPENFFDSAKTKAFLNLNKAPTKSILKKKEPTLGPGANAKATGNEWISSGPTVKKSSNTSKSSSSTSRTPAGGSIKHLQEENDLPTDFFDSKSGGSTSKTESDTEMKEDGALPEGFFDDPVQDAKARGIEYKDAAEEEWEAFQKEISAEVLAADEAQAAEVLMDTTERQLEEIEDQMQAWSRVREAEIKKDEVDEKLKVAKSSKKDGDDNSDSDQDIQDLDMDEFLDWRLKKS